MNAQWGVYYNRTLQTPTYRFKTSSVMSPGIFGLVSKAATQGIVFSMFWRQWQRVAGTQGFGAARLFTLYLINPLNTFEKSCLAKPQELFSSFSLFLGVICKVQKNTSCGGHVRVSSSVCLTVTQYQRTNHFCKKKFPQNQYKISPLLRDVDQFPR
jgi:hypothetical protein